MTEEPQITMAELAAHEFEPVDTRELLVELDRKWLDDTGHCLRLAAVFVSRTKAELQRFAQDEPDLFHRSVADLEMMQERLEGAVAVTRAAHTRMMVVAASVVTARG